MPIRYKYTVGTVKSAHDSAYTPDDSSPRLPVEGLVLLKVSDFDTALRHPARQRIRRAGWPRVVDQPICTSILRGRASARFGMRTLSTPSLRFASIASVASSPLKVKPRW